MSENSSEELDLATPPRKTQQEKEQELADLQNEIRDFREAYKPPRAQKTEQHLEMLLGKRRLLIANLSNATRD